MNELTPVCAGRIKEDGGVLSQRAIGGVVVVLCSPHCIWNERKFQFSGWFPYNMYTLLSMYTNAS